MVTEESGKKYQVGGCAQPHLGKDTQEKHLFCLWRNITSPQIERYILQEYVTEERLEVPVEFDEGINNLLKKIEVVASLKFILKSQVENVCCRKKDGKRLRMTRDEGLKGLQRRPC